MMYNKQKQIKNKNKKQLSVFTLHFDSTELISVFVEWKSRIIQSREERANDSPSIKGVCLSTAAAAYKSLWNSLQMTLRARMEYPIHLMKWKI